MRKGLLLGFYSLTFIFIITAHLSAGCKDETRAIGGPCEDRECGVHLGENCGTCSVGVCNEHGQCVPSYNFALSPVIENDLDILFMVTNTWSMDSEQHNLGVNFLLFLNKLEKMKGGLPNVHIGVISSDLGAGQYTSIRYCENIGGDRGVLGKVGTVNLAEQCIGFGQRYIVDVEPNNCVIDKNEDSNTCTSHSCEQYHCDGVANSNEELTIQVDDYGCPRCRNYMGEMTDTFACMVGLGVNGCSFVQQLEATKKALSRQETPENMGFLRDNAYLAMVLLTDEDDCSASHPDVLFNPDPEMDNIDSDLGYLHAFRCFEFGVTCDINDRTIVGPRLGCVPREDDGAFLHKISMYTSFIESIKDPSRTIIAGFAGPVPEEIMVHRDHLDRPVLEFCNDDPRSPNEGAVPAIRIKAFLEHFNTPDEMSEWAFTPVYMADYGTPLTRIAENIVHSMTEHCLPQPLAGCSQGPPGTVCSPCLPNCVISDIENRNTLQEKEMEIVWCGRVCQNGLCAETDLEECDFDHQGYCHCSDGLSPTVFVADSEVYCAPLLYHEDSLEVQIDERLLTLIPREEPASGGEPGRASACWYLNSDNACEFGAAVRIVRGSISEPRTLMVGRCAAIAATEDVCDDGVDNDEDCLTDDEDPDCT